MIVTGDDGIEQKKAGETVTAAEKNPAIPPDMTDLMSALEASLNKTKKKPATRKKKTKEKKEA